MSRKTPPMRTLSHASSIRIGDTIRISGQFGDMQVARVGIVAARQIWDGNTDYVTSGRIVILTIYRDGQSDLSNLKIQLLKTVPEPTLF